MKRVVQRHFSFSGRRGRWFKSSRIDEGEIPLESGFSPFSFVWEKRLSSVLEHLFTIFLRIRTSFYIFEEGCEHLRPASFFCFSFVLA